MSRRGKVLIAITVIVVGLAMLFQIDLVRQQLEIAYMRVTHTQWVLHGRLVKQMVYSPALGQTRRVYVYTPPGYDDPANSDLRYPTLYLLHGSPDLNAVSWIPYGRAPQVVDRLIVEGRIHPMIVVCPDGKGPGSYGDSEYIDAPDPRVAGKPGTKLATFITTDVVGYVDSHYRTITSPAGRWIGGVSSGAYGAVNLGLHRPDLFGTIVSLSGYFTADPSGDARRVWGYNPSPQRLWAESPSGYVDGGSPKWAGEFIFLGDGTTERQAYRTEASDFAARLAAAHIAHMTDTRAGRHSWDLWRSLLTDALLKMRARIPAPANTLPVR